jgi:hypothetical protein
MMRTRRKKENRSDWWFTMEQIGRELRKVYPPADTPPGLHHLFTDERRRSSATQQNREKADEVKDDGNSK